MSLLNDEQIMVELSNLAGWERTGGSLVRKFKTHNFPQTLGLCVAIGSICQAHDHHPDFMTLKYGELEVSFSTHSEGGITLRDINVIKDIQKLNF
ncbi:MAG: 4a-hydroxytetrahydrobiopterin dehydratase [Chlorobi bacterium OLB4]|jgi:Pterin-4a-carbinolamine dehydratase|nr:MAG: 4a-hydroxytetrahydrobiopterin dehydratase [Chlorobi bacterium OLB4]MBW7856684.1 4a-hydroxytetrahydrobiopterin dehydratase [Ignavibacteria bacterium]OQY77172.1 MAG: hypothetical protein B6D43_07550 [Ignavibacteriales bacterium UTCHB1]